MTDSAAAHSTFALPDTQDQKSGTCTTLIALFAIIALQAWVTLSHDAWLDEWQAMLLASQSPDLGALLTNLHYEGHPPLWYLILRGLAPLGDPRVVMQTVALAIASMTATIVMVRAPFKLAERISLCLGYLLLVEYGSIARGMSIGVMLMFAFVAVQWRAMRWVILMLLPMVEVQFAVLAVAGMALMWRDRQWSRVGAALVIAATAIMVVLVWPASDVHTAITLMATYQTRLAIFLLMFGNVLVPMPMIDGAIYWFGNAPGLAGIVFAGVFVWLGVYQLRGDRGHQIVFLGFCAFTLFMALFVYQLSIRHGGLAAILLVILTWRSVSGGGKLTPPFRSWLWVSAICGIVIALHIQTVGFDSSTKAAQYIDQHGLKDRLLVSFDDQHAVPVGAVLGRPVVNLTKNCAQTYIRWDRATNAWTAPKLADALRQMSREHGEYYLISGVRFEGNAEAVPIMRLVKPVAAIMPGYTSKAFYIYKVGAGLTGRPVRSCPPRETKSA